MDIPARLSRAGIIPVAAIDIIQKAQWEAEGVEAFNQQHFVGTGPWVFDQWIDGQYVHVTKNPSYWGGVDSYYYF